MKKKIDWLITLLPLGIVIALCIVFFFMPEQSNEVLGKIRFFFGDTFGTYYLIIGLGIFIGNCFNSGFRRIIFHYIHSLLAKNLIINKLCLAIL